MTGNDRQNFQVSFDHSISERKLTFLFESNSHLLLIYYGDSGVWYSQYGTAADKFTMTYRSLIVIISCKTSE